MDRKAGVSLRAKRSNLAFPKGTTRLLRPNIGLAMTLLLIGCSTATHSKNSYDRSKVDLTPSDGGSYVEASIADASFLNPVLSTDSASNDINNLVYNGLLKYDKNIALVGDLAESWDVADGGKKITFHLRKGVLWHDGKPFTSADVLFTYQALIDTHTRTAFSSDYLQVKKVEVPDDHTFRVIYNEPFAPALESWGMGILPRHIWAGTDINNNPANRKPIGTGPYIFKEWVPDEKIVLTANPSYFRGKPHIARYIYRIIPDQSVQFLELRQGTLSMAHPTPDQYNGYADFFRSYDKYHYPAFRYDYMAFNLSNPLFQDVRVRQAINESINKTDIIKGVYQGLAVASNGPYPPTSWASNPEVKSAPYNPEQAKKLLAEAGWKDGNGDGVLDRNGKPFEFTLATNQGNKVRESIAVVIQNGLNNVGIKVNVRIVEWSVFIHKDIDEKQFEAVLLGWSLSRDPDCYQTWHSSQMKKGQYNFISYKNPEVDRLIEQGRKTFDKEKRTAIYHRIHALIAADVPYVFLTVPESLPVVHKQFIGVELAPAGIGWNFEEWFIPKAWQGKNVLAS